MPLSESPRTVVPLALPSVSKPSSRKKRTTKHMFFCGVVVENEPGQPLSEEVDEIVASLGDRISSCSDGEFLPATLSADQSISNPNTRKLVTTDASLIQDVVNELVATERSYVKRLRILKCDYADPLRSFARSDDTVIIPIYEANTLFGNVDNLLHVNERFLEDLEKMIADDGPETVGYIGDVALRHFKESRGFDLYKTYYMNQEQAQIIFEQEMAERGSSFALYVDRIKYSSTDSRNRIGLRELLMDPVRRVPQYTLLFRTMIQRMHPNDPQLVKLLEADEIASNIALDVSAVRASVLSSLSSTIDGFPPNLYSNGRRFIDCIDVEDLCSDGPTTGASPSANSRDTLPCSLFLFDDKIVIVERPSDKGAKSLAGLNQLDSMVLPLSTRSTTSKKTGLSCKGIFGITQVVATDIGNAEFHLYLENPPEDQSERWAGRAFRFYRVAIPPAPANSDPTRARSMKEEFLEKLWNTQAFHRTKLGQSVVLLGVEREVESRGGRVTKARTYFNVYERTLFLREVNKTKAVVHIDVTGAADPIPCGINGPPLVVIHIQPMAGEISRYSVTYYEPGDDPEEEEIVHTMRIPERVVHTIHKYGLFKSQTGNSIPTTPTATSRSKAAKFGFDVLSENLWHAIPGSYKGDIFDNLVNSHPRAESTISSSTQTTADSMRFSARSASTAGTSVASEGGKAIVEQSSRRTPRSVLRQSPGDTTSEPQSSTPKRLTSRSHGRSQRFSDEDSLFDDEMADAWHLYQREEDMDQSEWDLTQRLELARRNNLLDQHGKPLRLSGTSRDQPVEEMIYEKEPSQTSLRQSSRTSVRHVSTPTPRSTTHDLDTENPRRPRSGSLPLLPTQRLLSSSEPELEPEPVIPPRPVESVAPRGVDVERRPSLSGTAKDDMISSTGANDRQQSPIPRQLSYIAPPGHNSPMTRAEAERLEEMRTLISRRVANDGPNRVRSRSVVGSAAPTPVGGQAELIDDAADEMEKDIIRHIPNPLRGSGDTPGTPKPRVLPALEDSSIHGPITFVIYQPNSTLLEDAGSSETSTSALDDHDMKTLSQALPGGGCIASTYHPNTAIDWMAAHKKDPFLLSMRRDYLTRDPLPVMLFPHSEALAIFESFLNPDISRIAQELADYSGLPIMVRSKEDFPSQLVNDWYEVDAAKEDLDPIKEKGHFVSYNDSEEPEPSDSGQEYDKEAAGGGGGVRYASTGVDGHAGKGKGGEGQGEGGSGSTEDGGGTGPGGAGGDGRHHGDDQVGHRSSRSSMEQKSDDGDVDGVSGGGNGSKSGSSGGGGGVGGGGGGGEPPIETDDAGKRRPRWPSKDKSHRYTFNVPIQISGGQSMAQICITYVFHFESPDDEQFSAIVDYLRVKTVSRHAQADRSYGEMAMITPGDALFDSDSIDCGYEPRAVTIKRTKHLSVADMGGVSIGVSGGKPTVTATAVRTATAQQATELQEAEPAHPWIVEYELGQQPADIRTDRFRSWRMTYSRDSNILGHRNLNISLGMQVETHKLSSISQADVHPMAFIFRNQLHFFVSTANSEVPVCGIVILISQYVPDIQEPEHAKESFNFRTEETLDHNRQTTFSNITPESRPPGNIQSEAGNSAVALSLAREDSDLSSNTMTQKIFKKLSTKSKRLGPHPASSMTNFKHTTLKIRRQGKESFSEIPLDERLARGWDQTLSRWRDPLWPRLCKHLHALKPDEISCPWATSTVKEPAIVLIHRQQKSGASTGSKQEQTWSSA